MKPMSKFQAHREAHQRWATPGLSPTDRVAFVTLRQKKVPDRCEVGWYVRGGGKPVVAGRGPTWEAAFADADARAKEHSP
jgi:hypothetical protein